MPRIYQTTSMEQGRLRVALVDRGLAELLVHRVSSPGMAHGDALWYITRDRQQADVLVYFVPIGMAQLKICFVDSMGQAGWQVRRPPGVRL